MENKILSSLKSWPKIENKCRQISFSKWNKNICHLVLFSGEQWIQMNATFDHLKLSKWFANVSSHVIIV